MPQVPSPAVPTMSADTHDDSGAQSNTDSQLITGRINETQNGVGSLPAQNTQDLPDLPDIGIYFDLDAEYVSNGQPASIEPGKSVTITITYRNLPRGMNEATLRAAGWIKFLQQRAIFGDLPIGWQAEVTAVDTVANTVTAVVNHLGTFSIFGEYSTYLPFMQR